MGCVLIEIFNIAERLIDVDILESMSHEKTSLQGFRPGLTQTGM